VPRSIEGVKIAALFSETRSGKVRINLRAEDDVNILPLAKFLGGGGHAQAAGAILECGFDQIVARVRTLSLGYLNNPAGLPVQEPLTK
jgi:phosphoesterase RecJ-like protein